MSAFEDIMTGLFEALEDSKNLCKTLPRHTISSESMAAQKIHINLKKIRVCGVIAPVFSRPCKKKEPIIKSEAQL